MTEGATRTVRHEPDGLAPNVEAGSVIAGYELTKPLGKGGMAVVWLARDIQLDRQVALKILAPGLTANYQYRQRFISESRIASAIDDPHIIPVYQAGEADGVLYIAMRYARGGDVGTLCRNDGPLPPPRVVAIVSAIASALDAAHEEGLIHRDVKPANMLIDRRARRPDHVYLADFGLSLRSLASQRLTMAGFVMGTPDYCSPEQINGDRTVTGQADQYALACSTLELLTGAPPFPRDDSQAILYAHLLAEPPVLSSRRPGLPPVADRVLARGMAKAAKDRYETCQDFADQLRDAFGFPPYLADSADVRPPSENAPAGGRHRAAPPSQRPTELAQGQPTWDGQAADRASERVSGQPPGALRTRIDRLRAEVKPDAVMLSWAVPADLATMTYKVVRLTTAPDGGQPDFRVLGTTSSTEFEDAGVPGGVLVSHDVIAIAGKQASASARTAPRLMVRDVANLRAQASADGSAITLRWLLPIRFGRVVIERHADPSAAQTVAPRRAVAEGSSWTDASPLPGIEHIYHVFAEYRDAGGAPVRTPGARVRATAAPPRRPSR
jgi:serine/threonine protein kinase